VPHVFKRAGPVGTKYVDWPFLLGNDREWAGRGIPSTHRPSLRGYHTASRGQSQTAQAAVPLRAAPGLPRGRAAPSRRVPYERQQASIIGDRVARRAASPRQRGRWRGAGSVSGDELTTAVTKTQTAARHQHHPSRLGRAANLRRQLKEAREGLRAPGGQRPQAHNEQPVPAASRKQRISSPREGCALVGAH